MPGKGGFIRTTLSPINDRTDPSFTALDMTMLVFLVCGMLFLVRFLVGN